ncbi:MAG TPA: beta-N-acetylhexosaminidase [Eubacteriales bacterium]|jgi:hexosaminidase|nr:beta-N-acetylhexosaminidase [Eubacteriales bacterium]HRU84198.1 beta-N-acetylhexosaminidase [Eubacteriales bacterium]
MKFSIIPKPLKITDLGTQKIVIAKNSKIEAINNFLSDELKKALSGLSTAEGAAAVKFERTGEPLGEEGYRITADGAVKIQANGDNGLFYGLQTLIQLIKCNIADGAAVFSNFEIVDKPRFAYRGYMLDICRHFFCKDSIIRQIDAIALLKLNKLHLHLSEDQGFRIESEAFSGLNEIGSYRRETVGDGEKHGGYLTKADIKEIVAYAKKRGIDVVPEIDIPGHTTAMLAAFPELSCRGESLEVATKFGIKPDILCAGNEKVYEFVKTLIGEIAGLFPYEYFHIGGDEAPKIRWENCPKCREMLARQKLNNFEELQGYFTNVVIEHLKSLGKTAIVWNESVNSGILDKSAVVQYWKNGSFSKEKVAAEAKSGRSVIVSKFTPYYLDYPYGMTPLKNVYLFEPAMDFAEGAVIGVESPLWTEYVADDKKIDYMTYPRLTAVAETAWSEKGKKDYAGFKTRLVDFYALLAEKGIAAAPLSETDPPKLKGLISVVKFFKNALKSISPVK